MVARGGLAESTRCVELRAMAAGTTQDRAIGPFQLLALGVNGIVGVASSSRPPRWPRRSGLGTSSCSWRRAGPAAGALTFARLGSRFDEDGGPVVFARAAFGSGCRSCGLGGLRERGLQRLRRHRRLTRRPRCRPWGWRTALRCGWRRVARLGPGGCVAAGLRLSARFGRASPCSKLLPLVLLVLALAVSWQRLPAPATSAPGLGWLRAALTIVFACQGFEIVP